MLIAPRRCRSLAPHTQPHKRSAAGVTARASTGSSNSSPTAANPWAQPGYLDAVVSSMPEEQQRAVVAGIALAIGAGTALTCTTLGPALSAHLPGFLQVHKDSWFPLGPIFMAAGVAHFTGQGGS